MQWAKTGRARESNAIVERIDNAMMSYLTYGPRAVMCVSAIWTTATERRRLQEC